MDLLATVRKEGSRGGQGDFKWSDVQNSTRREHYLGHSLMAPVGRWAKGRDLNWYAKGDDDESGEDPVAKAARERKEEIQRIKQVEEDALARALGLPVPDRSNANLQPVSDKREVDKTLKQDPEEDREVGRGIGYGTRTNDHGVTEERLEGDDRQIVNASRVIAVVSDGTISLESVTAAIITATDLGIDHVVLAKDVEAAHETTIVDTGLGLDLEALDEQISVVIVVTDRPWTKIVSSISLTRTMIYEHCGIFTSPDEFGLIASIIMLQGLAEGLKKLLLQIRQSSNILVLSTGQAAISWSVVLHD